jgi:hypothetical protein
VSGYDGKMAGNPDDWSVVYEPGAFDSQVGKTVPVKLGIGGPVIGRATLRADGEVDMVVDEGSTADDTPE